MDFGQDEMGAVIDGTLGRGKGQHGDSSAMCYFSYVELVVQLQLCWGERGTRVARFGGQAPVLLLPLWEHPWKQSSMTEGI